MNRHDILESFLIPYKIWRFTIIHVGLYAWYWLGMKPSAFLFGNVLVNVFFSYYRYNTNAYYQEFWYWLVIDVTVNIGLLLLKLHTENTKDENLGVLTFSADILPVFVHLYISFALCEGIMRMVTGRNPVALLMYFLFGFYFLNVSGESGRLWSKIKSYVGSNQRMIPVGSRA